MPASSPALSPCSPLRPPSSGTGDLVLQQRVPSSAPSSWGERLCRAWDLFRAGDMEGAEEIFAVVDPEGHGKIRVGEVRKQRLAVAEAQAAEASSSASCERAPGGHFTMF